MPQAVDMINLGFLSESEQELILEVLRRDEELRQAEELRVRWEARTSCYLYYAINFLVLVYFQWQQYQEMSNKLYNSQILIMILKLVFYYKLWYVLFNIT